jgi:hypothetical protein
MSNPATDLKRELLAAAERQHRQASVPASGRRFGRSRGARRLLPIGVAVAFASAAALFFAAPWSSSAPPIWTPTRMEDALGDFGVLLVGDVTDRFGTALGPRSHANVGLMGIACRGLGPRTHGGYALFRCKFAYFDRGPGGGFGTRTGSYWTRPWTASTVCVSNVSRGTCPPPLPPDPIRGDPRKCVYDVNGFWGVRCLARTAKVAATKRQGIPYKRCVAGAVWTTYTCSRTGGHATVKFIQHPHSWTTRVTSR